VKYYAPAMWASVLLTAACSPKIVETVTIRETQTVHDTITLRDSVTLVNDRVQVEIVRLPGERFYVKGTCKGDTVKVYTDKTITKVKRETDKKTERAAMVVITILGLALLAVILKK
jgi:hypothetical protein